MGLTQQNVQGIGTLDLNDEKVLGLGSNSQISSANKSYTLSLASRILTKSLGEQLQAQ